VLFTRIPRGPVPRGIFSWGKSGTGADFRPGAGRSLTSREALGRAIAGLPPKRLRALSKWTQGTAANVLDRCGRGQPEKVDVAAGLRGSQGLGTEAIDRGRGGPADGQIDA